MGSLIKKTIFLLAYNKLEMKRKNITTESTNPDKKPKGLSNDEKQLITTGIGDYEKCARMYMNNVMSTIKTVHFRGSSVIFSDDSSSKVFDLNTKVYEKIIDKNKFKTKDDSQISTLFESVYLPGGKALNKDIIRTGAIIRIWSVGSFKINAESHSTATIDYGDRRVSFGTSLDHAAEVFLNNESIGNPHLINSPEEEMINKVLVNSTQDNLNKPIYGLRLIAIGILTEEHITNLQDILISNTKSFNTRYVNQHFIKNYNDNLIYPLLTCQTVSTTLFYNKYILYNVISKDKLELKHKVLDKNGNWVDNKYDKVRKLSKDMTSTNCAGLMSLIFNGIVCINSTHSLLSFPDLNVSGGPVSLLPSKIYKCIPDTNSRVEEPSLINIQQGRSLVCSFIGIPKYITNIVYTTLFFSTAYLIIPLLLPPSNIGGWSTFINSTIFGIAMQAVTSIKIYSNMKVFSFNPEPPLSKEELTVLLGKENFRIFLDMAKKQHMTENDEKQSFRFGKRHSRKRRSSKRRSSKRRSSKRRSIKRHSSKRSSSKRRSRKRSSSKRSSSKRRSRKRSSRKRSSSKRRSRKRSSSKRSSRKRRSRKRRSSKRRSSKRRSSKRRSSKRSSSKRRSSKRSSRKRSSSKRRSSKRLSSKRRSRKRRSHK